MNTLTLENRVIDLHHPEQIVPKNHFEKAIYHFLSDWLSGSSTFKMQTSGSTGNPSTVELTRSQMEASARASLKAFELVPGDTIHLCLNTEFIAGKMMLVRALTGNLNVVAEEPKQLPGSLGSDLQFTALVPMQLESLLEDKAHALTLNGFKAIIVGGAPVSLLLEEKLQSLKCPVYATFGMTETATHVALRKLNGIGRSKYYKALEEVTLGKDDRGCLTICGPMTNNETIVTNDRIQLVNDQEFEWLGRWDNVVNSGGVKIQLEQVEKAVAAYFKDVNISHRYFACSFPDHKLGERLVLCIEGSKPAILEKRELLTVLKSLLPPYHAPKEIFFVEKFNETPTGKVDRKATLAMIRKDF